MPKVSEMIRSNAKGWDFFERVSKSTFAKKHQATAMAALSTSEVAWNMAALHAFAEGDSMHEGRAQRTCIKDKYKILFNEYAAAEEAERADEDLPRALAVREAAAPPAGPARITMYVGIATAALVFD